MIPQGPGTGLPPEGQAPQVDSIAAPDISVEQPETPIESAVDGFEHGLPAPDQAEETAPAVTEKPAVEVAEEPVAETVATATPEVGNEITLASVEQHLADTRARQALLATQVMEVADELASAEEEFAILRQQMSVSDPQPELTAPQDDSTEAAQSGDSIIRRGDTVPTATPMPFLEEVPDDLKAHSVPPLHLVKDVVTPAGVPSTPHEAVAAPEPQAVIEGAPSAAKLQEELKDLRVPAPEATPGDSV